MRKVWVTTSPSLRSLIFRERCNLRAQARAPWGRITPGALMRSLWAVLSWVASSGDRQGLMVRVFRSAFPHCNWEVRTTRPAIEANGFRRRLSISTRRRWPTGTAWRQRIAPQSSPIFQNSQPQFLDFWGNLSEPREMFASVSGPAILNSQSVHSAGFFVCIWLWDFEWVRIY